IRTVRIQDTPGTKDGEDFGQTKVHRARGALARRKDFIARVGSMERMRPAGALLFHRLKEARRMWNHVRTQTTLWGFGLVGEVGDPVAGEPKNGPFFVRPGPQFAVKLDCRFVPVEYRPFHAPAFAIARDLGQPDEQGPPITATTFFRPNEKVFEV